ncbi:MAG TPA: YraN family protein, partial [Terriglobales bacterium]|nr:YraN family protein [Terriglobales bacterium]
NFRCPVGELDLIAIDGSTLVFIEVKARTGSEHGHPLEAITRSKQRQISRAAQYYLRRQRLHQALVRFDVVAITWSAQGEPIIELVKDAFPVM